MLEYDLIRGILGITCKHLFKSTIGKVAAVYRLKEHHGLKIEFNLTDYIYFCMVLNSTYLHY